MGHPDVPRHFLRLLGGATLEVDGVPATGRSAHRHRTALLALLAVSRGRAMSRDKLIAYLWPERDSDAGRNLLKVAVHGLRKELGDAAIRTAGDQLTSDPVLLRSDVGDFLDAVAAGDDAAAAASYGGPFLDGFFIRDTEELERWIETQRQQLATSYVAAVERLARGAEAAGDIEALIRWQRALLAANAFRADVARDLVRALVASGDRAAAIQFAESFVRRREDELSIGDEEGIVQLARDAPATPSNAMARTSPAPASVVAPRPASPLATPLPTPREPRRRRIPMAGVGAFVVLLAVATAVAVRARGAATSSLASPVKTLDPNAVAILPFRTSAAEPALAYLQDGMAELLAAEFTGEGGANAVDPTAVSRTWSRATSSGKEVDRESARAIARELGAGQVLIGSIVGTRARMTITASIVNVETGEVRARTLLVEGSADSLAAVVGNVAAQLLSRDPGSWRLSAKEPGTTSTEALRSFIDGRAAYKHGHDDDAFNGFARALDLDSSFVLAAYWLTVSSKLTKPVSEAQAARAYGLAWRQQARLGPDRRELLHAMLGPGGPEVSTSIAQIHQAVERAAIHQSASAEAWFLLGDLYFHRGAVLGFDDWPVRARDAFEHAVSLDTVMGSVSHLATLAVMERDMPRHARWLQQLERLAPEDNYTLRERYAAAVFTGTSAERHQAREAWVRRGGADRDSFDGFPWALGIRLPQPEMDSLLATLTTYASTDEQRRTVMYFTRSAAMNGGQPARAAAARLRVFGNDTISRDFDLVTYAENDSAAAEHLAGARGDGRHLENELRCEAILARLRRGDTTGAAALSRVLRAANNPRHLDAPVCAALIDAVVQSLAPNATTASLVRVDSLLRTNPPGMPAIWMYDLAVAYARRGDYRSAAAAAGRRMLPRSARMAVSMRDEGKWAALAGDTARAIHAWRQYLQLRSQPEPPVMGEVAGVRTQLARLEKAR